MGSLGAWPWPRKRIADLIELTLGEYQAKGVALDIFFSDPKDAEGDQRLANLVQFGPVVLAQAFDYDKNKNAHGNDSFWTSYSDLFLGPCGHKKGLTLLKKTRMVTFRK